MLGYLAWYALIVSVLLLAGAVFFAVMAAKDCRKTLRHADEARRAEQEAQEIYFSVLRIYLKQRHGLGPSESELRLLGDIRDED
ncbi:hypothetical protein [Auritidibacter ignavus]|uniref:hypothetical protein n=1 Tax=Auritidibacter ignavus TaxID=678932 RepID=UPI002FE67A6B